MFKKLLFLFIITFVSGVSAQEIKSLYKNKKIAVQKDTIQIDSVSINKSFFKLQDQLGNDIDTTFYKVDFQKSILVFKNNFQSEDTLTLRYFSYPEYLTKKYSIYDESRVVANDAGNENRYTVKRDPMNSFTPFDGLTTSGSITRGITGLISAA